MTARPASALLLALTLSLPACTVSLVREGAVNRPLAEDIERGLSVVRGLGFRRAVPIEVSSPDRLRTRLRGELDREFTPQEIRALQTIYSRLGLLPAGADLSEELVRLYGAQVAGFYDSRTGKLFLVDPPPASGGWLLGVLQAILRRDLVGEMLLAHELTHALQDQHFDVIGRMSDGLDDDRALAAAAVVEGDATLAGFAYLFGGLPERSLLDLVHRLQGIPAEVAAALPDAPAVLRESLVFRYTAGARFVSWAHLRGGWDGVNAILAHPPRSTEQVLWPEKYYAEVDDPTVVHLGGLEGYRGSADWELVEENTLGELMVRVLFREFFDQDRAEWVARGWDGDRFAAWARGGETHVYWMSTWDSTRDAKDFFQAEAELLARRFPHVAPDREPARVLGAGDDPYWVERRDRQVLVILGVSADECAARAGDVWAGTTFTPARERLPLDLAQEAK